jgi:2-succinyl-6-hydroxy-2,4-cyclohexadiene-1-carboxylate synthase
VKAHNPYQFNYNFVTQPNAPLILFLHGFLGHNGDWNEIIMRLKDDFSCLAVDLPGHGLTKVAGTEVKYNIENCANGIITLLNQLQVDRCHIVGYSMGGRLALYLALFYPQRFFKVVLESASPGLRTVKERDSRLKQDIDIAQKMVKMNIANFIHEWYSQPIFYTLKRNPRFKLLKVKRLRNDLLLLSQCIRQMSVGRQPSLWHQLRENHIPILLLAGAEDDKYKQINAEMEESCPYAKRVIIGKCGHNIHFENPEKFALKVRNFLT